MPSVMTVHPLGPTYGADPVVVALPGPEAAGAAEIRHVFTAKTHCEVVAASLQDAATLGASDTNYALFRLRKNGSFTAGASDGAVVAGPYANRATAGAGAVAIGALTAGSEKDLVVTADKEARRLAPGDRLYFEKYGVAGSGAALSAKAVLVIWVQGGYGAA